LYEVRPQGGNLTSLFVWQGVIEEGNRTIIPPDQTKTRFYISTPLINATTAYKVSIHYLNVGNESVEINFWNITSNEWTIPFSTIIRTNSGDWRTHTFIFSETSAAYSKFTVFGIYSHHVDFQFDYVQVTLTQINYTAPPHVDRIHFRWKQSHVL